MNNQNAVAALLQECKRALDTLLSAKADTGEEDEREYRRCQGEVPQERKVFCAVGPVCSARNPLLTWGNRFPLICWSSSSCPASPGQCDFLLKAFLMADGSHLPGGQSSQG
uniref:Uncharacterized protein n=1 Tax=Calidris pygmaea TaxID=425635 RepID=A0A8C3J640_9CHAR